MKAIVKNGPHVSIQECPLPRPQRHEVRIKVEIAASCRTDQFVAQGLFPAPDHLILGHEFSGIVDEVGGDVGSLQPGDRVAVMPVFMNAAKDDYTMLGVHLNGAFAEYVCVPASFVVVIPDSMDMRTAAYAEPVAASLAVAYVGVNMERPGIIVGDNRIAQLTYRIARGAGMKHLELISANELSRLPASSVAYAIETTPLPEVIEELVRVVEPRGQLVLKSRPYQPVVMPFRDIVKKELVLIGAHYGDFSTSVDLLAQEAFPYKDLFGPTISFEEAVPTLLGTAFTQEQKKIFIDPSL